MAYLDLAGYKLLSIIPPSYIDEVEDLQPGWFVAQSDYWSAFLDSRLTKRYSTPFEAPVPFAVRGWLARLLDLRVMLRRGVDATDAQFSVVEASARDVSAEITEAADAVNGLWDLPLRSDTTASAIVRPVPLFASDGGPYAWSRRQRDAGRNDP